MKRGTSGLWRRPAREPTQTTSAEPERDRRAPREDRGQAFAADLIEEILQIAEPLGHGVLLAAVGASLLERAGRDEEAAAAFAPRVAVDGVANEPARERLVAGVAEHRVHDDRRIADREEAPLADGAGDGKGDVAVRVGGADLEDRREIGMREPDGVVRDDARHLGYDRVRGGRLGEGELRVVPQHLGGVSRRRDAAHVEFVQERIAAPVVVEQDDATSGLHELGELRGVERPLGIEENEAVLGFELGKVDHGRGNDMSGLELRFRPVAPAPTRPPSRPRSGRTAIAWAEAASEKYAEKHHAKGR